MFSTNRLSGSELEGEVLLRTRDGDTNSSRSDAKGATRSHKIHKILATVHVTRLCKLV